MKRILTALIAVIVMTSAAVAGPLEDGLAAAARGDFATALTLLKPVAEAGDATAQDKLGFMYAFAKGVSQDYAEAAKWYRLSAEQGFAEAQHELGVLYANGHGVPQDDQSAYLWSSLAAAQGDKGAGLNRDMLAKLMTPNQIAEAQRLVKEWKPTPKP